MLSKDISRLLIRPRRRESREDRLDEIIKRLARIEKHLGIPDEPPPPTLLRVIQYHYFHVDYAWGGFGDPALCGFYETSQSHKRRLFIDECQEIIDNGNSHVLCPQCYRVFQEKYSRDVVRGLYLSLNGVGTHRERVQKVIDSLDLPAAHPIETYSSSVWFWQRCLMLKYWKPDEHAK